MKTKFFLLLIAIVALGCKDDKAATGKNEATANEVVKSAFKVSINVIVKKDDAFSLFYTEDGSIDFKGDPIWMDVKGSDSEQTVTYTLPEDVFPTEFRMDFGVSKSQQDIVLKSIQFDYQGKKRLITQGEIGNFFRPDESKCTYDAATGTLKTIVKDGVAQNASMYPHESTLKPELEKLAK